MKLLRSLAASLVEALAAVAMIGAGAYVAAVGAKAASSQLGLLIAGGALTTLGGVLLSWVASKGVAHDRAQEEFNQRLDALSRALGQAGGHISRVVVQAQKGEMHPATAFALVSQAARMIYGQVNEIAVLRGTGFDSAYLLETAQRLDGLAKQLEQGQQAGDALQGVRQQIEDVRSKLSLGSKLSLAGVTRSYASTVVPCPHCSVESTVELGTFAGDTAVTSCSSCKSRFNVHRDANGGAFTRALRGPAADGPRERWEFACPACASMMTASKGDGGVRTMVCVQCSEGVAVDSGARSCRATGKFIRSIGTIVGMRGKRPLSICPECERQLPSLLSDGSRFFAFCLVDRQLIEIGRDQLTSWESDAHGGSN